MSTDQNGYLADTALDALLNIDRDAHEFAAKKMIRSNKTGDDAEGDDGESEKPSEVRTNTSVNDSDSSSIKDRQDALTHLRSMYRSAGALSSNLQARSRRIEIAMIVISVLTSGTLWTLISARYPDAAAWCGAVLSTLVTGLTLYQHQVGPMRRHREILALFHEIGQEIAVIEASTRFNRGQFWHRMKFLEFHYQQVMSPPKKGEPVHVPA